MATRESKMAQGTVQESWKTSSGNDSSADEHDTFSGGEEGGADPPPSTSAPADGRARALDFLPGAPDGGGGGGEGEGPDGAWAAAVSSASRATLGRRFLVVWDVDCCLVKAHMWGTHRRRPLEEIPIDDGLFPDAPFFRALVRALRAAGVAVALATFGRADVATALARHAMRERDCDLLGRGDGDGGGGDGGDGDGGGGGGGAAVPMVLREEDAGMVEAERAGGAVTCEEVAAVAVAVAAAVAVAGTAGADGAPAAAAAPAQPAASAAADGAAANAAAHAANNADADAAAAAPPARTFGPANVSSPADFDCPEGSKALGNKDAQLCMLAQRQGIAPADFGRILFFDDTLPNVEGAALLGVAAHESKPFTPALWAEVGAPWCRQHGIVLDMVGAAAEAKAKARAPPPPQQQQQQAPLDGSAADRVAAAAGQQEGQKDGEDGISWV